MSGMQSSLADTPPPAVKKALDTPAPAPQHGRMIIDLVLDSDGHATPKVSFQPVGMFTPGFMSKYVTYFAQQIVLAQSAARGRPIENKESF